MLTPIEFGQLAQALAMARCHAINDELYIRQRAILEADYGDPGSADMIEQSKVIEKLRAKLNVVF